MLPVIEALKRHPGARVSIDTMKAGVARRALDAGADLINDVAALRDPEMLPLAVERQAPVVLMLVTAPPYGGAPAVFDDTGISIPRYFKTRFFNQYCQTSREAASMDKPGPIVVDSVIFCRYTPLAEAGLAFFRSSSNASRFSLILSPSNPTWPRLP